jgi:hypothetical protein
MKIPKPRQSTTEVPKYAWSKDTLDEEYIKNALKTLSRHQKTVEVLHGVPQVRFGQKTPQNSLIIKPSACS